MFKNYITTVWRNLLKRPLYSLINITGLSCALACAFTIFLYAHHELSYDNFHSKSDRIFRVIQVGDDAEQSSSMPFPTGPTLHHEYPTEVADYVRLFNFQASTLSVVYETPEEKKAFNEPRFFFADSSFFSVFDFPLVSGNSATALSGPDMIVITESTAKRYFGDNNPMGKTLKFEGKTDMLVTGVVKDLPSNAHFRFDLLASFSTLEHLFEKGIPKTNWYWNPVWTYVLLHENANLETLSGQFPFFVDKYYHPSLKESAVIQIQPLRDVYLRSKTSYEIAPMGDIRYVYLFLSIAVVILLIACINYINLATARASERFKETGIRKVSGASKKDLIARFLLESIVITLLSAAVAVLIFMLTVPALNNLMGKQWEWNDILYWKYLLAIVFISVVIGLSAGVYPSLVLAFRDVQLVLRSNPGTPGNARFRRILVVSQFIISLVFLSLTITAFKQIKYMQSMKLGFEPETLIGIPIQRLSIVPRYNDFKDHILSDQHIVSVTASDGIPGKDYQTSNYKREGDPDMKLFPCLFVRNDFTETTGIKIIAGKSFTQEITAKGYHAIINEAMATALGWKNPEDAVGQILDGTLEGKVLITGVAENFNYASLHETVGPMILLRTDHTGHTDFFTRYIIIKVNMNNIDHTLGHLRTAWNQFAPESPFDYFFLENTLHQQYSKEETFRKITAVFSILAVLINMLGLLGLTAFAVQKRKRELSIRKVLGAEFLNLTVLLSKEFVVMLAVATLVGIPLSLYGISQWLSSFPYRITPDPIIFVVSLGIIVLPAFFIIITMIWQASRVNPVETLRTE